jgi:hypothetical protein
MGPVEEAIRRHIHEGDTLHTTARRSPFQIGRIDEQGLVLRLGSGCHPVRLSWECLEGVVPWLAVRGTIPIGGTHSAEGQPGTVDEYFKGCTPVNTARWVTAVLEAAGVVEVLPGRPVRVRLAHTGRTLIGFFRPTEGESDEAFAERVAAAFREMPEGDQ